MSEGMACLSGVTKRFGSIHALADVTLEIRRGELLAVLGPNGAGKSTAIALLLGLQRADAGCARLFGADPRLVTTRHRVGVMMLYVFFGVVLAQTGRSPAINMFIFTGFAVMGVIGPGVFGFGVFVAVEREQGLLKLKRALPMPPAAYLVAKMLMTLLFALLVTLTVIAAALAFGKVVLSVGQLIALATIVVAGALPFCAIGLLIGSWAGGRSAPAFVNLLYLPMIYLSGFLIPLPKSFAAIQLVSPAYHLDRLALWSVGAAHDSLTVHVAVLATMTIVGAGMALRRLAAAD